MLEVAEAREIVLSHAKVLPSQITPLASPALGQVLAVDISSDIDSPPFDKSMMDGYALRSVDCTKSGTELTLIEEIQAGATPTKTVNAGECSRIFTGAPIPQGIDAVVMKEKTEIISDNRIRILDDLIPAGKNIIRRCQEMKSGDVVIPSGTVLTPAAYGLFASVGKTAVMCHPPARVTIVATGNEVVEPIKKPGPSQIRNSNGPMLVALTARAGALPRYIGIARDKEEILRSYLFEGLTTSNVLLIAGGVSAGAYDLVPHVLESLGVTIHFHKIRMKPGKPLLFGSKDQTLVFGLPGNPVSGFVGFELFVKPALRAMAGHIVPPSTSIPLSLAESLSTTNDRPTYHPAVIEGNTSVKALPWFGSADLRGLLTANAFIALPAGDLKYSAGQTVDVIPF